MRFKKGSLFSSSAISTRLASHSSTISLMLLVLMGFSISTMGLSMCFSIKRAIRSRVCLSRNWMGISGGFSGSYSESSSTSMSTNKVLDSAALRGTSMLYPSERVILTFCMFVTICEGI